MIPIFSAKSATSAPTKSRRTRTKVATTPLVLGKTKRTILLLLAVSWWFYPIWTAQSIPYDLWNLRMWFPSWV